MTSPRRTSSGEAKSFKEVTWMQRKSGRLTLILVAIILLLLLAGGLYFILPRLKKEKPPVAEKQDTAEIDNILKLARYYMEKEEYDLARQQLEQALIKNSENAEALALLEEAV